MFLLYAYYFNHLKHKALILFLNISEIVRYCKKKIIIEGITMILVISIETFMNMYH